jgi:SAM-dependent methyltransferase
MSRLDSFIRRLTAQRDILDVTLDEVRTIEGPVLELGLGNGRTFDHIREALPGRRIVAFDWDVRAHSSSVPDGADMVLGNIRETAQPFVGIGAAMAHADIGTGYDDKDAITLTWLPQLMAGVLRPGGIAISGLPLDHPGLKPMLLPASVKPDRYFLYRRV